ncbi:hypothetical protein Tco_0721661 [Tanacetum coccineum]
MIALILPFSHRNPNINTPPDMSASLLSPSCMDGPFHYLQDGSADSDGNSDYVIEPLQGLETIVQELQQEDGIIEVKITRLEFEKRVVSHDLQLCLSYAPPNGNQFTLLARAGRQLQKGLSDFTQKLG